MSTTKTLSSNNIQVRYIQADIFAYTYLKIKKWFWSFLSFMHNNEIGSSELLINYKAYTITTYLGTRLKNHTPLYLCFRRSRFEYTTFTFFENGPIDRSYSM